MKTPPAVAFGLKGIQRGLFFHGLLFVAIITPFTAVAATSSEPKTHTLFMGTNLSIERNNAVYPVEDVLGGSLVIRVKGERVNVPMKAGPVAMKLNHALKLTERSATIANLKGERRYTPANDPNRRFRENAGAAMAVAADMTMASGGLVNAQLNRGLGNGAQAAAATEQATTQMSQHSVAMNSFNNSAGEHAGILADELAKELYDAVEITFDIASEKPLSAPYVVVVARFNEKGAKPGEVQNWIYAEPLDRVDDQLQKVRIFEGGFPLGFELKDYQVHLYNRGEEIATNVAPKRVELTRDQAFEYVKMEYIGAHKAATLPAVPAMGRLPGDVRTRLANGEFGDIYYVKVTKDGTATAVFSDAACSRRIEDPYLDSLVKNLRFKPALEKGKPVEAVTPLKLSELAL